MKKNNDIPLYFSEGTSTEELSTLDSTLEQQTTSGDDSRIEVSQIKSTSSEPSKKMKSTSTETSDEGDNLFLDDKEYEIGKPKRILIRGKIFVG